MQSYSVFQDKYLQQKDLNWILGTQNEINAVPKKKTKTQLQKIYLVSTKSITPKPNFTVPI